MRYFIALVLVAALAVGVMAAVRQLATSAANTQPDTHCLFATSFDCQ